MVDKVTKWVFISHSSHDRKLAERLCAALEDRGLSCWIASRNVLPGENYQSQIVEAISRSSAMILVFSINANNSDEIKKELAVAGQALTPVIPVRAEDVLPSGAFKYELATRQWVDLFDDWEGAVRRLVIRIGETGPGLQEPIRTRSGSYRPISRAVKVAALAIGVCVLGLGGWYLRPSAHQAEASEDPPALYAETDATRLSAFTLCTPPFEYKPGFRHWTRVAPDRWKQEYPDGSLEFANVVSRTRANDCDGSIVKLAFDANFEAFLPDKSCSVMEFLFRRLPSRSWVSYVHIEKLDAECKPNKT